MNPFEFDVEVGGDTATFALSGELDVASSPDLRDHVLRVISEGRTHVVFDCSSLDFVDSTGLGVFIGARARCLAANGFVELTGTTPSLRRLLTIAGVDGLFEPTPAA